MSSERYDIVIMGSGMGGLACANILAQNGLKVIVLEKNIQAGGNLQSFGVNKVLFDTGVHYVGGLDYGQNLYALFNYFGIYKDLKLEKMDPDGYDRIHFFDEDETYPYGMGYDHFIKLMTERFPEEEHGLRTYVNEVKRCIQSLPLSGLDASGDWTIPDLDFTKSAKEFIYENIGNQRLRDILSAPNMLYAGQSNTPFYFHALVMNGYMESAWRFRGGTSQIARLMTREIQKHGGRVQCSAEVTEGIFDAYGALSGVKLKNGEIINGECFISNIHPEVTVNTLGPSHFSKRFLQRFARYRNTGSVFIVNIVLKEKSFKYRNYNIFQINNHQLWDYQWGSSESLPTNFFIAFPPPVDGSEWARGMTIISGMEYQEVEKWKETFHTTRTRKSRGLDYEQFKMSRAQKVIDSIESVFPGIKNQIEAVDCITPLTFRDYTYTPRGSAYGYIKDVSNPLQALMSPRTSIPNLYLTGQNIAVHGILGVCFSALITCFQLIDRKKLLSDIDVYRN